MRNGRPDPAIECRHWEWGSLASPTQIIKKAAWLLELVFGLDLWSRIGLGLGMGPGGALLATPREPPPNSGSVLLTTPRAAPVRHGLTRAEATPLQREIEGRKQSSIGFQSVVAVPAFAAALGPGERGVACNARESRSGSGSGMLTTP
jgi:hypothetical protein